MKFVFVDSDIFVRDLRYPRDGLRETNDRLLDNMRKRKIRAATSIFNVLEICGVLSFNYSQEQLADLYSDFTRYFAVKVFLPADAQGALQYDLESIWRQIAKKQSLDDAQVAYVVERFSNLVACFVSWNARHFEGKLSVPVMTPAEFLKK